MKDWTKKTVAAFLVSALTIPAIASGFYLTYQLVTFLGN